MSQRPPMLGQLRCPKNPDDGHPAATMVVAGLNEPEMKIEIEVTAFRG